jgi:dolichyl-phosphate beta-glucosyltransferase
MKKLSVVIPSFNEGQRIAKTLAQINDFLKNQDFEYEILVVNDGSTDNTSGVVKQMQGKIENLKLLDNKENHGKGWVTKQGMLAANGDVRLFTDADNSTSVDNFMKMKSYFEEGFDVVIGSRRVEGSVIAVHQPWLRDFLGGVFRTIVHTLVPLGVADSQCGFKAFTADACGKIFPKQKIFRWAFDVEILALAKKEKMKIKEVPITWINDTQSHVKISGMIKMLFEVLTIRMNLWLNKY